LDDLPKQMFFRNTFLDKVKMEFYWIQKYAQSFFLPDVFQDFWL